MKPNTHGGGGRSLDKGSGDDGSQPGDINVKPSTIFCRDNLEVLRRINSETVDLVYLDPPFNKGKQFHAPIGSDAEGATFSDIWREDMVKDYQLSQLQESHPDLTAYINATEPGGGRSLRAYLIFMAVRLLEIHRILKPTGSVFLHCDTTANSYLRLAMDIIFGSDNFANEIVWGYRGPGAKKKFGSKHDTLLFYRKSQDFIFNPQYTPMLEATKKLYRHDDNDGKGKYLLVKNKKTGKQYKSYLKKNRGRPVLDWWEDIQSFNTAYSSKERTGYPTQKPLALLDRIIRATTDEGDMVLDPFAGCATACVAAHLANRRWIGIDVSDEAYRLVKLRLERHASQQQITYDPSRLIFRKDLPERTDLGDYLQLTAARKAEVRKLLYGEQEGNCNHCGVHQEFASNLAIDHRIPQSRGGLDHLSNLQLLCTRCNSVKGDRTMAYLASKVPARV